MNCLIGNKTVTMSAQDREALTALIEKVLKETGNLARPPTDWIVRLGSATLLHDASLAAHGVTNGATLVFTLGPSESGGA